MNYATRYMNALDAAKDDPDLMFCVLEYYSAVIKNTIMSPSKNLVVILCTDDSSILIFNRKKYIFSNLPELQLQIFFIIVTNSEAEQEIRYTLLYSELLGDL